MNGRRGVMCLRSERGVALPIVVLIGLIIGALALSTFRFVSQHSETTGDLVARTQAEYAAKAGVEYALFSLRNKTSDDAKNLITASDGQAVEFGLGSDGSPLVRSLNVQEGLLDSESSYTAANMRQTAKISIVEDGTTEDNLRKRYRITSQVTYRNDGTSSE